MWANEQLKRKKIDRVNWLRAAIHAAALALPIFFAAAACHAEASKSRLPPVDESSKDPSFRAFRDKLLQGRA
jgi:hypothetical protein